MVFDWFFKKDVFELINLRIKRISRILSNNNLLIDHFVEIKTHIKQIQKYMPEIYKIHKAHKSYFDEIIVPKEEYKKLLTQYSQTADILQTKLQKTLTLVEEILRIRIVERIQKQKNSLELSFNNDVPALISFLSANTKKLEEERRLLEQLGKKEMYTPVSKIKITGRLNNGWSLSDIQTVILELGGRVVSNPGGRHQYKMIFPAKEGRPEMTFPFGESKPPIVLIRDVSEATQYPREKLKASFAKGKLVA